MSFRKWAMLALVMLGVLLVASVFLWSITSGQSPFTKGMQTNGYETFVAAAALKAPGNPPANTNEFESFLLANRDALALVRQGLNLPAELPDRGYEINSSTLAEFASFKALAQAMRIEAQHAAVQERFSEAANTCLDMIRFGHKLESGTLISFLMGLAVESMGLRDLEQLEPKVSGAHRARIAAELEALRAGRISFEEVQARERYFMRRNAPTPYHYLIARFLVRKNIATIRGKHAKQDEELRRVAAKFTP